MTERSLHDLLTEIVTRIINEREAHLFVIDKDAFGDLVLITSILKSDRIIDGECRKDIIKTLCSITKEAHPLTRRDMDTIAEGLDLFKAKREVDEAAREAERSTKQ